MKIGIEELPLNSWAKLCQYNAFRDVLGSGINSHLKQSDLLRDIFQMGPAPLSSKHTKSFRLERVSWYVGGQIVQFLLGHVHACARLDSIHT